MGASSAQYWRHVALPILTPSILGAMILLFGNAFGAQATAFQLTGGTLNLVPIIIGAQIRGDVLHNPGLGYAMAMGMVLIMGLSILLYTILQRRAERWLRSDLLPSTTSKLIPGGGRDRDDRPRRRPSLGHLRLAGHHWRPVLLHAAARRSSTRSRRARTSSSPIARSSRIQSSTAACSRSCRLITIVVSLADRPDRLLGPAQGAPLRPVVEFVTLMPFVPPPVVMVFGPSASTAPSRSLTASNFGSDILLVCAYVILSFPYMYRAVDTPRVDRRQDATEAAQSLGRVGRGSSSGSSSLNIRTAISSGRS
jgi:ABC-type spermidine/putrescine transport system permease subunit II